MKSLLAFLLLGITLNTSAQEIALVNVSVVTFEYSPIPGAQIHFFDTKSEKVVTGVSNEEGKFDINLGPGLYEIQLKSIGQVKDYSAVEIPTLKEGELYGDVEIIIRYEEETSFTLSNLHFETGKSVIKSLSYDELDDLAKYLELKPELKIEIAGHTDNEGSDNSNLILSQSRAEAVSDYLISKGIDPGRVVAKGYGEGSPIADNNTEQGKALNRRTEIHIIE